jgi:hypothetical protein
MLGSGLVTNAALVDRIVGGTAVVGFHSRRRSSAVEPAIWSDFSKAALG